MAPSSYVSYSLTAANTVRLDTLLLPVPEGTRAKASLNLVKRSGSARVLELKADSLKGYYLRAADDGTTRDFGPYSYDGPLAYVDQDQGVQRILLTGGTTLRQGRSTLLTADQALEGTLAVRLNRRDKTIEITGTAAEAGGANLWLAAAWARGATVAGQTVRLVHKGHLVSVAALR
ncbi:hypothetical protein ACWCQM_32255 [Streptomyces sp. NPDC002125]